MEQPMALKKLSKSDSRIHHEVEVFSHASTEGTKWLWACQHGCYDATPYDKFSRAEANRLAQAHASVLREN